MPSTTSTTTAVASGSRARELADYVNGAQKEILNTERLNRGLKGGIVNNRRKKTYRSFENTQTLSILSVFMGWKLSAKVSAFRKQLHESHLTFQEEQIAYDSTLKNLKSNCSTLKDKNRKLDKEVEDLRTESTNLEDVLSEKKSRNRVLEGQLKKTTDFVHSLRNQLHAFQKENLMINFSTGGANGIQIGSGNSGGQSVLQPAGGLGSYGLPQSGTQSVSFPPESTLGSGNRSAAPSLGFSATQISPRVVGQGNLGAQSVVGQGNPTIWGQNQCQKQQSKTGIPGLISGLVLSGKQQGKLTKAQNHCEVEYLKHELYDVLRKLDPRFVPPPPFFIDQQPVVRLEQQQNLCQKSVVSSTTEVPVTGASSQQPMRTLREQRTAQERVQQQERVHQAQTIRPAVQQPVEQVEPLQQKNLPSANIISIPEEPVATTQSDQKESKDSKVQSLKIKQKDPLKPPLSARTTQQQPLTASSTQHRRSTELMVSSRNIGGRKVGTNITKVVGTSYFSGNRSPNSSTRFPKTNSNVIDAVVVRDKSGKRKDDNNGDSNRNNNGIQSVQRISDSISKDSSKDAISQSKDSTKDSISVSKESISAKDSAKDSRDSAAKGCCSKDSPKNTSSYARPTQSYLVKQMSQVSPRYSPRFSPRVSGTMTTRPPKKTGGLTIRNTGASEKKTSYSTVTTNGTRSKPIASGGKASTSANPNTATVAKPDTTTSQEKGIGNTEARNLGNGIQTTDSSENGIQKPENTAARTTNPIQVGTILSTGTRTNTVPGTAIATNTVPVTGITTNTVAGTGNMVSGTGNIVSGTGNKQTNLLRYSSAVSGNVSTNLNGIGTGVPQFGNSFHFSPLGQRRDRSPFVIGMLK